MDVTTAAWSLEAFRNVALSNNSYCFPTAFSPQNHSLSSPIWSYPFRPIPTTSCVVHSKKRNSRSDAVLKPSIIDEVLPDDEDDDVLLFDELEDRNHCYSCLCLFNFLLRLLCFYTQSITPFSTSSMNYQNHSQLSKSHLMNLNI